jgi:hypothetical protein
MVAEKNAGVTATPTSCPVVEDPAAGTNVLDGTVRMIEAVEVPAAGVMLAARSDFPARGEVVEAPLAEERVAAAAAAPASMEAAEDPTA